MFFEVGLSPPISNVAYQNFINSAAQAEQQNQILQLQNERLSTEVKMLNAKLEKIQNEGKITRIQSTKIDEIKSESNVQNCKQKLWASLDLAVEVYRAFVSSALLMFVPQYCENAENNICNFSNHTLMLPSSQSSFLLELASSLNYLTFIMFIALYIVQYRVCHTLFIMSFYCHFIIF